MADERPATFFQKLMKLLGLIGAAVLVLKFTPVGGIVQIIVGGGSLVGAAVLLFNALFDSDGLKDSALKLAGVVLLLGVAMIATIALPSLPGSGGRDICWDGRSNSGC